MSMMESSVTLRLQDDLTRPARQAAASVKSLVKDLEKLKSLSGKSNGVNRQMQGMVRELKNAQKAAQSLRREMGRQVPDGFKRAVSGIERVRSEAMRATRAVADLESRLRRGGSFNGGSGHGGRGGGGHGGGHGGYFRHVGRHAVGTAAGISFAAMGGEIAESIVASIHAGMEQSFERAHTKVALQMQGESANAITDAVIQSERMARSLPSFTSAQHLEAIAELRPALLGGLEEATKLAPMFQQSVAVLEAVKQGAGSHALKGVDTHGEALDLVRALEIKGETGRFGSDDKKNEANMQSYVDAITKAIVGMNGQIGAKDFHSAFKFARGDASNWSQEFSTEILPTIMNELKKSSKTDASQAGNALKSMSRAVVDNVMTPQAMGNWERLGMYDPSAIKKGKGGKDTVKPGEHMLGYELFQSNPYQFVQDYLLPHMKEHGIDIGNRSQVVATLGGLFGNRVANQIAAILATQQAQIKKDQDNIRKAQGSEGLKTLTDMDPVYRMQVLASAFKELGGAIGDLALPGVMRGMKGVIDWAHHTTEWLQNDPGVHRWAQHFEAGIAGFFKQDVSGDVHARHWMAHGKDKEFYDMGKSLRDWFSSLKSQINLESIGSALSGIVSFTNEIREDIAIWNKANDRVNAFCDKLSAVSFQTLEDGINGLKFAFSSVVGWLKSSFAWLFPEATAGGQAKAAVTPPAPLVPTAGNGFVGMRAKASSTLPGAGGLGLRPGAHEAVDTMYKDIALAAAMAIPGIQQSGVSSAAALAAGIQSGSGQASASMSALMSALAAIAAGGITVPVKVDTSGAEAQLSALIAKMGPGLKGARNPQFSKSQSDLGAPP